LGGEPGQASGVLGIYLGNVPPAQGSQASPTSSKNGWAWWAGTSFATPIITGIMAAMLSNMLPGGTPQQVLAELRKHPLYWTKQDEEALLVKQREPQNPL
jgi:subtilisin family serine protease